jgi:preprotein translocase subunit SecA
MKLDFGALPARIGKALQNVFGSANQRSLARYQPLVKAVNDLGKWAEGLDQAAIKQRMASWREQVQAGSKTLDDALPEVFAMTRVAATRTLRMTHFDVQLIGGAVLHQGNIAEMATGEGKTLVATLPCALNALSGRGVFVVTVNDYLAKRDRDWMAPIYEYLGLTVGAIQTNMLPQERQQQYACDIAYGTNSEFGFDYLRDNMKWRPEEQVQKSLNFAIVDEVDSILIDEARTPLIISGESEGTAEKYIVADRIARQLKDGVHFEVKLKEHQVLLNDDGIEKAEQLAGVDSFYANPANMDWPHHIEQSLRAQQIYERDKHYVVVARPNPDGSAGEPEVVIVDEFTGRLMPGRRWSDGLHQAVEAKEGIKPRDENRTLATITIQNYFRMFDKLAGMTGTAMTEAAEFGRIYDLDVVSIPTNRPMVRIDSNDQIFLDENSKITAITDEIRQQYEKGRPVLIGTTSIAKSERLATELQKLSLPHNVLNAKQHAREAEIIVQAGRKGALTVATNMAGRGTDIVLGGNPEALWRRELKSRGLLEDSAEAQSLLEQLRGQCRKEHDEIVALGGLYVLGTERHEARRIDNQLRGRCGRQGDPGESKFFLSFDDDLMKIFARDWVKVMMEKMGLKAGEVIDSPMVSRGIARAQKKVEARNFDIRKNLIEYDEVMDKQRKFIYSQRQQALEKVGLRDKVLGMFEEVLDPVLERYAGDKDEVVDFVEIRKWLVHKAGHELELDGLEQAGREPLFDWIMARIEKLHDKRGAHYGEEWERLMQFLLLDTIDNKWKDHLLAMEVLKSGIGLRSYAQIDPKNEYKKEGYQKFELLKDAIADQVTDMIYKVEFRQAELAPPPPRMPRIPQQMDPVTAQAMVEAMIAAGQAPQELIDAVARGAKITVRPQAGPGRPGAPAQGRMQVNVEQAEGSGDGKGAAPAAAEAQPAPTPEPARPRPVPAAVAAGKQPEKPATGPRPGRNDLCPCGSGVKYKKCCFPAFG